MNAEIITVGDEILRAGRKRGIDFRVVGDAHLRSRGAAGEKEGRSEQQGDAD